MKVLLIRPPSIHFKNTAPPVIELPLSLLYLAAVLEKQGEKVQIYDASLEVEEVDFGQEVIYLGASWGKIEDKIREINPDIVGINNPFSSQIEAAGRVAEIVKRVNQQIITVVGGPHASAMPSSFFERTSAVDVAVVGEGEYTLPEIINWHRGKKRLEEIQGIVYKKDGRIIHNPRREFIRNLDELPLPAYHLCDLEKYFQINQRGLAGRNRYAYPGSERAISMFTSRGCPFNCNFCSIHLSMGKIYRVHSAPQVLAHICYLVERYAIRHIHFEDDNLSLDPKRFEEILDGLIKFKLTWDTPNGVRADSLSERILLKCRESGCTYLRIGVESGDEEVLNKIIRKNLDLNKVVEVAELCRKVGLDLEAFYIIGFPGEKLKQMEKTIDFAIRLEEKYNVFPYDLFTATPLVGTELFEICKENKYFVKPVSAQNLAVATQGEGMIETENFKLSDISRLIKKFKCKHFKARLISLVRFSLANPKFIIIFVKNIVLKILAHPFRFKAIIFQSLKLRYKNCLLRKVGEQNE